MSWKVKFYQTARGDYPVRDFIDEQDEAAYAKIIHTIKFLADNGPYLKPPYPCTRKPPPLAGGMNGFGEEGFRCGVSPT